MIDLSRLLGAVGAFLHAAGTRNALELRSSCLAHCLLKDWYGCGARFCSWRSRKADGGCFLAGFAPPRLFLPYRDRGTEPPERMIPGTMIEGTGSIASNT